jgi:hypothetical protein
MCDPVSLLRWFLCMIGTNYYRTHPYSRKDTDCHYRLVYVGDSTESVER